MTKEKLRRYFELDLELTEDGRLDSTDNPLHPRWDEYCRLKEEFDAWEPDPEEERLHCVHCGTVLPRSQTAGWKQWPAPDGSVRRWCCRESCQQNYSVCCPFHP